MKYLVLRKSGTVVSRHRALPAARRSLHAYLTRLARKTDKVLIFTIANTHVVKGQAQVLAGEVDDADGRAVLGLYGSVVKLVDPATPKNRRRSSRGRR